jgi:hypothetical protein
MRRTCEHEDRLPDELHIGDSADVHAFFDLMVIIEKVWSSSCWILGRNNVDRQFAGFKFHL